MVIGHGNPERLGIHAVLQAVAGQRKAQKRRRGSAYHSPASGSSRARQMPYPLPIKGRIALNIRVVIADDHPVLLAGMEHMLAAVADIQIVGLAADSTGMVDLLASQQVDVVVADFSMPQGRYGDGIALLRFLDRRFPQVRRLVLTGVENPRVLRSIQEVGVDVIVGKTDPHLHLEHAIRCARAAQPFLSPVIQRLLEQPPAPGDSAAQGTLTKRESEVLRMFAEGSSVAEIGERVGRSRKTISTQKMSAMRKLGLARDGDIFRYAISSGLVQASQVSRSNAGDDDA
ncbi:response regulator [Stenotrophomonas sp. BIGb0135]|uniref:response regulator n=1 Tax=Stenotrophomonas sp. BIGb0135 TaxID=2940620 RepID=UPI002168DED9|nr:response regulator [Stenotrophomonas sp. BIGb0135]MCS4233086.1 two-component system capsular synthesis response regulator RcsB [Stenotrophomonas sp. BIGb0135]